MWYIAFSYHLYVFVDEVVEQEGCKEKGESYNTLKMLFSNLAILQKLQSSLSKEKVNFMEVRIITIINLLTVYRRSYRTRIQR